MDWDLFFSGRIPPIGTTGWKECVYGGWIFLIGLNLFKEIFSKGWEEGENGGWIFLIGLNLFKEIFSKGWEEGENGGWKLEGWMFRNWMDGWHDW